MPFVTPGDPAASYLVHKIDDNLCVVTGCIANNAAVGSAEMAPPWCGGLMPYQGLVLDSATRDTIRRWIQQGAMNN